MQGERECNCGGHGVFVTHPFEGRRLPRGYEPVSQRTIRCKSAHFEACREEGGSKTTQGEVDIDPWLCCTLLSVTVPFERSPPPKIARLQRETSQRSEAESPEGWKPRCKAWRTQGGSHSSAQARDSRSRGSKGCSDPRPQAWGRSAPSQADHASTQGNTPAHASEVARSGSRRQEGRRHSQASS